ncbi:MAG: diguanylate cyclase [Polaromonas sp.]|uniref:sensor domain-containing diguanylate cyclase n=1 Tax=Polaromonas sp. TaxID=1869339 RepID=UPI002736FE3A|nr:diguanylate cyclase [Polaromonas sp.]MDP2816816.1 diguanylate cyclase [Polaromonas sp.]
MDKLAYGFWGCYFGTTALMLAGSAMAFNRSLHRISLNAALSATASGFFVLAFLGALPISDPDSLSRFLAHVAIAASSALAYLLFSIVGALDNRKARRRTQWALVALALGGVALGWLLPAAHALAVGVGIAWWQGLVALGVALRSAWRGDRLAWQAFFAVLFLLIAMIGLGLIALARGQMPWQVHAVSALAGTAYLSLMASALWVRYSYQIELNQIMAQGPSYDPVTRMRSHSETGQMLVSAFKRRRDQPTALGMLVVSIGNLYTLEKLHGTAAMNHALFVCAGRLRQVTPAQVELGRFGEDGFLLLLPECSDSGQLIKLAHRLGPRMAKAVTLNTSLDSTKRESEQTRWRADLGIGVLMVSDPTAKVSVTLATARAMSRTAMSYASRVAWFDHASGEAVELPVLRPS